MFRRSAGRFFSAAAAAGAKHGESAGAAAAGATKVEPPLSSMGKVAKWISTHRQALTNIFGMYIVFTYSIHNYRVQLYVDERDAEFALQTREMDRLKAALADDTWCTATEEAIRKNRKLSLKAELDKVVSPLQMTQEERVLAKMKQTAEQKKDSSSAELAGVLGSIFGGGNTSTPSSPPAPSSGGTRIM